MVQILPEPSANETAIALKLLEDVTSSTSRNQANIQEIYKLYLTISTTLLTGSVAANAFGHPSLALICCITPCLSLVFAKWRTVQTVEIIDYAAFIRFEFDDYLKRFYPGLRTSRLSLVSWNEYALFAPSHKIGLNNEGDTAMWILHFPSVISLVSAYAITLSSISFTMPSTHCHRNHHCEFLVWWESASYYIRGLYHDAGSLIPIGISSVIWLYALKVSLRRKRLLEEAIGEHRTMIERQGLTP